MAERRLYALFGLTLESDIPLPELPPAPDGATADVTARVGCLEPEASGQTGLVILPGGAHLNIPQVGRFWMEGGREMRVEPAPGASERNVRLYLLGSAFAAILHQRGLLPLHANALVVEGRAIGFMGHSGAGKSTLAAWFHDNGFDVLADDVCVVTQDSGAPIAHAGIPRLRLWREALVASGRSADDYELSFDDSDKYTVPTRLKAPQPAAPLSHVYLLEKAEPGAAQEIERLSGSAAVEALVANTYRGAYVPMMGRTHAHLFACASLARSVPVFRARRAWGFDQFDVEARALEAHSRRIIAGES